MKNYRYELLLVLLVIVAFAFMSFGVGRERKRLKRTNSANDIGDTANDHTYLHAGWKDGHKFVWHMERMDRAGGLVHSPGCPCFKGGNE